MRSKEKCLSKYKGPLHIRKTIKEAYKIASRLFLKSLQNVGRQYNKFEKFKLDEICTTDLAIFWKQLKKLRPSYKTSIPLEVHNDKNEKKHLI